MCRVYSNNQSVNQSLFTSTLTKFNSNKRALECESEKLCQLLCLVEWELFQTQLAIGRTLFCVGLHAGPLLLVVIAVCHCERIICSTFVKTTQSIRMGIEIKGDSAMTSLSV